MQAIDLIITPKDLADLFSIPLQRMEALILQCGINPNKFDVWDVFTIWKAGSSEIGLVAVTLTLSWIAAQLNRKDSAAFRYMWQVTLEEILEEC